MTSACCVVSRESREGKYDPHFISHALSILGCLTLMTTKSMFSDAVSLPEVQFYASNYFQNLIIWISSMQHKLNMTEMKLLALFPHLFLLLQPLSLSGLLLVSCLTLTYTVGIFAFTFFILSTQSVTPFCQFYFSNLFCVLLSSCSGLGLPCSRFSEYVYSKRVFQTL